MDESQRGTRLCIIYSLSLDPRDPGHIQTETQDSSVLCNPVELPEF